MENEAPNFKGRYPNDGEKIGPAWREAWDVMADGRWYPVDELQKIMGDVSGIVPITASNLLRQGRKCGYLEGRYTLNGNNRLVLTDYRRLK